MLAALASLSVASGQYAWTLPVKRVWQMPCELEFGDADATVTVDESLFEVWNASNDGIRVSSRLFEIYFQCSVAAEQSWVDAYRML
jgi:hypothetical protein